MTHRRIFEAYSGPDGYPAALVAPVRYLLSRDADTAPSQNRADLELSRLAQSLLVSNVGLPRGGQL
jgi:hypothetical protein